MADHRKKVFDKDRSDCSFQKEELSGHELICLCDDEGKAEQIAVIYEIELLSFSDGIAVYRCSQDPQEIIEKGVKNGYPMLSLNRKNSLHSSKT